MKKYFYLFIYVVVIFSACNEEKEELNVGVNDEESVLLKNNPELVSMIESYILDKESNNTKSGNDMSEIEELDFETGVVIGDENENRIFIVSKDLGEFEVFNMYYYSIADSKIILEETEQIQKETSVKSACSQKCFDDIKKKIESNHILKSVYGAISWPLDLFVSRGCLNECRGQH